VRDKISDKKQKSKNDQNGSNLFATSVIFASPCPAGIARLLYRKVGSFI